MGWPKQSGCKINLFFTLLLSEARFVLNKDRNRSQSGKAAAAMQMLQQFFGEQGARYATWVLTVIVLLILVLVVWNLLKRALGDRLNMGDRPDRRGRPPRLGITESFTVDRQGRRLVMVRRDNVEHLVMIGGPNDFVVETSIVRGERPAVARTESRQSDNELVPALVLSSPDSVPVAAAAPMNPLPPAATPMARAPYEPAKPALYAAPQPVATKPAVDAPVSVAAPTPVVAQNIGEKAPAIKAPDAVKPAMSLADRFRAALPAVGTRAEAAPPVEAAKPAPAQAESVKAESMKPDLVKTDAPKVDVPRIDGIKPDLPRPEPARADVAKSDLAKSDLARAEAALDAQAAATARMSTAAEATRARMDDALQAVVTKPATPPPSAVAPVPVAAVSPPPVVPSPVAPPVVPPATVSAPPAPVGSQHPAAASKPVSKNPFDSLEEEMAKLLGRAPDGKG
jgi:flagellar protein FliO/FliZ